MLDMYMCIYLIMFVVWNTI